MSNRHMKGIVDNISKIEYDPVFVHATWLVVVPVVSIVDWLATRWAWNPYNLSPSCIFDLSFLGDKYSWVIRFVSGL
jgi:hypothetical protein